MRTRRAALLLATLLSLLPVPVSAGAVPASAAPPDASCDGRVGPRTPIVLVHGFNTQAEKTWEDDTRTLLAAPRDRFCTTAFEYGPASTSWVRDRRISGALATRVLTLARASKDGGGSGRVIVVAHSMGGLAIRCAASSACGGQDEVGRVLRAVVTFDTPNEGSLLRARGLSHAADVLGSALSASCRIRDPFDAVPVLRGMCGQVRAFGTSDAAAAFTPGSAELRALPRLPTSVPVLAVAGSVKLGTSFWGRKPKVLGEVGDLVVSQDSALAGANRTGGLGGEVVRDCGVLDLTSTLTGLMPIPVLQPELRCTHVTQTNNPDWTVLVTELVRAVDDQRPRAAVTRQDVLSMTLPPGHGCSYAADEFTREVRLRDGKAESRSGGFIEAGDVILLDVDGDRVGDGLTTLVCSSGAGGTSSSVVVLDGARRRAREVPYTADAERRLPELSVYRVYDVGHERGVLTLVVSGHRESDSTCCPSEVVRVRYDLGAGGPRFKDAVLSDSPAGALPGVEATAEVGRQVRTVLRAAQVEVEPGCGVFVDVLGGRPAAGDLDVVVGYDPSDCGGDGLGAFSKVRGSRVVEEGDACECDMESSNWAALMAPYRDRASAEFDVLPAEDGYQLVPRRSS